MENTRFILCDSDLSKREAYKIRYQFYINEIKVLHSDDYPDGLLYDEYDNNSLIFLGYLNDIPMITMRVIDNRFNIFEMAQYIDPASFIKDQNCVEFTRLICLRDARHTGLTWKFIIYIYDYLKDDGIKYIYHARRENNITESIINFFIKTGGRAITDPFIYGKYGEHRIYEIDMNSEAVNNIVNKVKTNFPTM